MSRTVFTRLCFTTFLLAFLVPVFCCAGESASAAATNQSWLHNWESQNHTWRGVHLWLDNDASAQQLVKTLPALAAADANVVVVEVNYSFEFQAHPEMRNRRFVTRATARELAETAHGCGIRLIPQFNCLGHQSFAGKIAPLLIAHPDFNETPSLTPKSPGMYCLSWCPRAPGLNEIVCSLIDEMADAFEADAFHVGMDEVYLIASDECPRCRGANPAELFAGQVRALHDHIVDQRHLQMLMWADRPIGPKYQGYSKFDNARNDLSASIDAISKDIIRCDWQYERKQTYPSTPFLTQKGFQVWPSGFLPLTAARAFSDFALAQHDPRIIGYLATTWNETSITNSPNWPPIKDILPRWRQAK